MYLEAYIKRVVKSNFGNEVCGSGSECHWKQNVAGRWRIRRIQPLRMMTYVDIIYIRKTIDMLSIFVDILSLLNACKIAKYPKHSSIL